MKAAILRGGEMVVDDVPDPVPGDGQVLVQTKACGICGSDLHAAKHADHMVEMTKEAVESTGGGGTSLLGFDAGRDLVMGHEFAAEVLELGAGAAGVSPGQTVVSLPVVADQRGIHAVGYSNDYPGGYAERMLLSAGICLPVPNGLDAVHAALTEPMAVGLHAVNRSEIAAAGTAALVFGAGPVGLAVIAALRMKGVEPIVAADFSARRRQLATTMGAHEVADPREEPAIDAWRRVDGRHPLVIFEAVGVPGVIDQAMRAAPQQTQIVVVGVCMETDHMQPFMGITKELTVKFSMAYDPMEFASTLQSIGEGELDVDPLITGTVGIDDVPQAFADLANPDAHAKIVVEP